MFQATGNIRDHDSILLFYHIAYYVCLHSSMRLCSLWNRTGCNEWEHARWEGEVVHLATLELGMLDNRLKRLNVSFLIP